MNKGKLNKGKNHLENNYYDKHGYQNSNKENKGMKNYKGKKGNLYNNQEINDTSKGKGNNINYQKDNILRTRIRVSNSISVVSSGDRADGSSQRGSVLPIKFAAM